MSDPLHDDEEADAAVRAELRRLTPHIAQIDLDDEERARILRAVVEHPRLVARLTDSRARLAETTERLQRAEREHRSAVERRNALSAEASALREDAAVLESERMRLQAESDGSRSELDAALLRIAELEARATAAERLAGRLEDGLSTADRELHRLRGENEGLKLDAMMSAGSADAFRAENETLVQQRSASLLRITELERDLGRLATARSALEAVVAAAEARAERLARTLEEDTARRTDQIKQLTERAGKAEAALEAARAQAEHARKTQMRSEAELVERRAEVARLRHENAALSVAAEHGRAAEDRLAEVETDLRKRASRDDAEQRRMLARIDALQAENAGLAERLALKEREIERLYRLQSQEPAGEHRASERPRPVPLDPVALKRDPPPGTLLFTRSRKALAKRSPAPMDPLLVDREPVHPDQPA